MQAQILSDLPSVKQVVINMLFESKFPFEIKHTGDKAYLVVESEDKIPDSVKPYVMKAKQDAKK